MSLICGNDAFWILVCFHNFAYYGIKKMWGFSMKNVLCPQQKHVIWTWHLVVGGFFATYQLLAVLAALSVKSVLGLYSWISRRLSGAHVQPCQGNIEGNIFFPCLCLRESSGSWDSQSCTIDVWKNPCHPLGQSLA